MVKHGKKLVEAQKAVDSSKYYEIKEAIALAKSVAYAKFDETLEVAIQLGVDPRHSDQMVRGVVAMPHGIGKTVRVAVFARDKKADEAKEAGADVIGAEELVDQIQKGEINFDICIATPDMMAILGRVAKVLGPKGLMPNPKLGTVTTDVAKAVQNAKAGQVEFRVEKAGIIHAGIGKVSFATENLVENCLALIDGLAKAKPSGAKNKYFEKMAVCTTMGPSVQVDLASVIADK